MGTRNATSAAASADQPLGLAVLVHDTPVAPHARTHALDAPPPARALARGDRAPTTRCCGAQLRGHGRGRGGRHPGGEPDVGAGRGCSAQLAESDAEAELHGADVGIREEGAGAQGAAPAAIRVCALSSRWWAVFEFGTMVL